MIDYHFFENFKWYRIPDLGIIFIYRFSITTLIRTVCTNFIIFHLFFLYFGGFFSQLNAYKFINILRIQGQVSITFA